jgi:hypothetical protein
MIRQYGSPDRAPAGGEEGRPTGPHFHILSFAMQIVSSVGSLPRTSVSDPDSLNPDPHPAFFFVLNVWYSYKKLWGSINAILRPL